MKPIKLSLNIAGAVLLLAALFLSCHKTDVTDKSPETTGSSSLSADSIAGRLQFPVASRKQGAIPGGRTSSALKISVEDTLYLFDQIEMPVKFLDKEPGQHVAGVYLQVQTVDGGTVDSSSYYYDVPEVAAADSSDTVSVIRLGIDPTGFEPPLSFHIVMAPYDDDGQPIDQLDRPVKVEAKDGGSCGLVLPDNEHWGWVYSFMMHGDFQNYPEKVWEAGGQMIKGSCCAGVSIYGICPGADTPNVSLHFATYYEIRSETLDFFGDGSFLRQTFEENPAPLPAESDFCAGGEGKVKDHLSHVIYHGNYALIPAQLPSGYPFDDNTKLRMNQTSQDPAIGGYGNGGGVVHRLSCHDLIIVQPDLEGFGQNLIVFYQRQKDGASDWFLF